MAAPKKRRSLTKIRRRRMGLLNKYKLLSINNISICNTCNKPRISHKYCCINKK